MKHFILLCAVLMLLLTGCAKKEVQQPKEHTHKPVETAETVEEPMVGYCGNTQTTVTHNDKTVYLMPGHSVTMTDLLINLDYDPDKTCKCADYDLTVTTEFGGPYYISLDDAYARIKNKDGILAQADLTEEQLQTIRQIIEDSAF